MLDVVALGELLVDFTHINQNEDNYPVLSAHPGGAPANFLAALAKFGASTALLGKIGDDSFGQMLCSTLKNIGIETSGLVFDRAVYTTLAFVTLDKHGNRSFSFARRPGADTQLRFEELDLTLIEQAKIFHFGTLSLTHEPARAATYQAVAYAQKMGKLITFDPNLRTPLWDRVEDAKTQILWGLAQADVVKISDDEVDFLFHLDPQAGAKHILTQYGAKLVFVTCGDKGCWFSARAACGHVDSPKGIQPVDTTGAGYIFGGSALWKLLQIDKPPEKLTEQELRDITRFACTAASLSTLKSGGIFSIPEYEDICTKINI